jgi:hypothetical protein
VTRKAPAPPVARSAEPLYREIRYILESARAGAYRAVNVAMVQAYWQVGRLIVEHEQKGRRRAGYGEAVIATLAERLTQDLDGGSMSAICGTCAVSTNCERSAFRIGDSSLNA